MKKFRLFARKEERAKRGRLLIKETFGRQLCFLALIQNNPFFSKRPPTNDRTCMGWHTRHASIHFGAGGTFTSRDAKPNGLESCFGTSFSLKKKPKQNNKYILYIYTLYIFYIYIYILYIFYIYMYFINYIYIPVYIYITCIYPYILAECISIYILSVCHHIGVIYVPFYIFKHQQSICGNIYMRGLYTYFSMFFFWAKVLKSVTQFDTN